MKTNGNVKSQRLFVEYEYYKLKYIFPALSYDKAV